MGLKEIQELKALAEYPKKTKRQEQEREYERVRKIYLKMHPMCMCGCGRKAKTIHHMRGRIGKLLTDMRYFKALSLTCHRRIENEPKLSKLSGLSESRLKKA